MAVGCYLLGVTDLLSPEDAETKKTMPRDGLELAMVLHRISEDMIGLECGDFAAV